MCKFGPGSHSLLNSYWHRYIHLDIKVVSGQSQSEHLLEDLIVVASGPLSPKSQAMKQETNYVPS